MQAKRAKDEDRISAQTRVPAEMNKSSSHELDRQIERFLEKSLPRMACNISVETPGAIIASPARKKPNYYFHWIRDSALVAESMSRLLPYVRGTENENRLRRHMLDFVTFSERLQGTPTRHGPGEVRFHVDGRPDMSDWPQPQYDGPALRALALLKYFNDDRAYLDGATQLRIKRVIQKDLESVAKTYDKEGYDLWEFARGYHFFTRLVQLGALERGIEEFQSETPETWREAKVALENAVAKHWSNKHGLISYFGRQKDIYHNAIPERRDAYDSSASLAILHADIKSELFDVMDERAWITLWKQQSHFGAAFPMNKKRSHGPGIGRDPWDDYYGGNPWFFVTAAFAELKFKTAVQLRSATGELVVSDLRYETLQHALEGPVLLGERFTLPSPTLATAFEHEGSEFLKTMLDVIPTDGAIAEQFDKNDGRPVSARDLTWSYASILTAILQREAYERSTVDFKNFEFVCPKKTPIAPRKASN
jgi:glucoamylase